MQEVIKDMVEFIDQYKAWHQDQVNDEGDPVNWVDFDEGRADYGEEAIDLVKRLAADRPEGIDLVFGDGADGDTFQTIFEVLTGGTTYDGYVIRLNGTDIQVKSLDAGDQVGISGLIWDDEAGGPTETTFTVAWEDINQVWIY